MMHDEIAQFKPSLVVVDPISNLSLEDGTAEVKPTLLRLIDLIKKQGITAVFTSLTTDENVAGAETSEVGVSSLMDTWLLLRNHEYDGERNRTIFVLKSRGMNHSNQVREFVMTDDGIDLIEVYLGTDRVLTGTARLAQAEKELAATELRGRTHERRLVEMDAKRRALEAQIAALQAEAAVAKQETEFLIAQNSLQTKAETAARLRMSRARYSSNNRQNNNKGKKS
jgi:circadian clock protein KaiC